MRRSCRRGECCGYCPEAWIAAACVIEDLSALLIGRYALQTKALRLMMRSVLRKSAFVLTVPFPVAVQATASISALPRAEKRFMNEPCRAIGPSDTGE
ncbi:hypothetical protein BV392_15475 [Rhodovulum sulfidophilum]|nr:hypothetical protein BV392_15475 [Rhodovulum sulfidophilum]